MAKRHTKIGFRCDRWQQRVDVFVGVVLVGLLICVCPTWEIWKSGKVRASSTAAAATFLRAVALVSNLIREKHGGTDVVLLFAPVSRLGNVFTDAVRFSVRLSQVWRIASRVITLNFTVTWTFGVLAARRCGRSLTAPLCNLVLRPSNKTKFSLGCIQHCLLWTVVYVDLGTGCIKT